MLDIILLIIKIIFICILVLLGIILLGVFIILFVPIKYKIKSTYQDKFYFELKLTWFLHLLNIPIIYDNNALNYKIKISIISIKSSKSKKKPKLNKKVKNKTRKKQPKKNKSVYKEKKAKTYNNENVKKLEVKKDISEKTKNSQSTSIEVEKKMKKEKKNIFKDIISKVANIISKFKETIKNVKKILSNLNIYIKFLNNDDNKEGFKVIYNFVKKLLKHIKAKKIKGFAKIGFSEPSLTGQALALVSVLGIGLKKDFSIFADFEQEVLEMDCKIKGRIRIFTVLIIIFKLFKDKHFKKIKSNYLNLKEELDG